MFGEKKYAVLATIVGLTILSVVAVPALIASNAAAQITTTQPGQGSSNADQAQDQGAEEQTASSTSAAGENSFSSSVNISPTEDSNAKVTIEGTGLTAKQMNVNQERQEDGTVKITVEGVFAVEGGATSTTTPSEGAPSTPGQTTGNETTTTTPTAPSSGNEMSLTPTPTKLAPLAGVTPSTGAAGDQVSISGSGFNPNQALTFSFDGASLDAGSVTTDSAGTFTTTATMPADAASGDHQVTVTDGSGASTTAIFTVVHKPATAGPEGNATSTAPAGNSTATIPSGNETSTAPIPSGNQTATTTPTMPSGNETSVAPAPPGNETSGNSTATP